MKYIYTPRQLMIRVEYTLVFRHPETILNIILYYFFLHSYFPSPYSHVFREDVYTIPTTFSIYLGIIILVVQ